MHFKKLAQNLSLNIFFFPTQVHCLRSVDNLFVVVQEFKDYQFKRNKGKLSLNMEANFQPSSQRDYFHFSYSVYHLTLLLLL